jgi:hypothetical protein
LPPTGETLNVLAPLNALHGSSSLLTVFGMAVFEKLDTDEDGEVTQAEWSLFLETTYAENGEKASIACIQEPVIRTR